MQRDVNEKVNGGSFQDVLESELEAAGVEAVDLYVDPDSVKESTPNKRFVVPEFVDTEAIKTLRAYSQTSQTGSWDPDLMFSGFSFSEGSGEVTLSVYHEELLAVYVLNVGVCLSLVFLYWAFMCCHNCFSCCPCWNKKSFGSRTTGKFSLIFAYFCVAVAAGSSWYGEQHFHEGVDHVTSSLRETAVIFSNLEAHGSEMLVQGTGYKSVADNAGCEGNHKTTQEEALHEVQQLLSPDPYIH
jgi:hypothetical protein